MNSFFKNWELKILALLSAIILWFFVVGIENYSFRFPDQIDVHAINIAQDLSVTNDLGKATLRIRATQDVVKNLTKSDFDVTVDLKNARAGEQDLPLVATTKNDKVTILKVEPATVHVIVEAVAQKEVKIKEVISGTPAKGFSMGQIQFTPAVAILHGGKTLLDKITEIDASIKLTGIESANFNLNVPLTLPSAAFAEGITFEPLQATAVITIIQNMQKKTVTVSPHLSGNATLLGTQKLVITPQNIIIQGDDAVLKTINNLDTETSSYEALKASTIPLKLKLILPDGITLADNQPTTILISLTKP